MKANLQALELLALLAKRSEGLLHRGAHHLARGGKGCCWPLVVGIRNRIDSFQTIDLWLIPMIHECREDASFFAAWLVIQCR